MYLEVHRKSFVGQGLNIFISKLMMILIAFRLKKCLLKNTKKKYKEEYKSKVKKHSPKNKDPSLAFSNFINIQKSQDKSSANFPKKT